MKFRRQCPICTSGSLNLKVYLYVFGRLVDTFTSYLRAEDYCFDRRVENADIILYYNCDRCTYEKKLDERSFNQQYPRKV